MSSSHHVVFREVASEGAGPMIVSGLGNADDSVGTQNVNLYSFCEPTRLLYDTVPLLHQKTSKVGFNGEPRPLRYQPL